MNRQSPTEDVLICLHDTLDHLTVTRWLQLYPVEILFLFQLFKVKLKLELEVKKVKDSQLENVLKK